MSKIFGPIITLCNPLLQLLRIAGDETDLERLRVSGQRSGNGIALDGIQNGSIAHSLGGSHLECCDQTQESSVELSICQMGARTHTGPSTVSIMGGPRAFTKFEITLWKKLVGLLEVVLVIVGCPCVLEIG